MADTELDDLNRAIPLVNGQKIATIRRTNSGGLIYVNNIVTDDTGKVLHPPHSAGLMRTAIKTLTDIKEAILATTTHKDADPARRFTNFDDLPDWEAPARLKMPGYMTSEAMLRNHDRADWQHVDPKIIRFATRMIALGRKQGIPLYVHGAFRTAKQQNKLVAKGRSNTRYPRASHCQGKAVDIVHGKFHWDMTRAEWDEIGHIGQRIAASLNLQIEWGGNWTHPWDPAHWQLTDWADDIIHHTAGQPVRLTPTALQRLHN